MRTSIRSKVTILHQIYIIWSIIGNRIVQCGALERDIKLHILGLQTREQEQQQKKTDASHIFKVCLFIQRKEKIRFSANERPSFFTLTFSEGMSNLFFEHRVRKHKILSTGLYIMRIGASTPDSHY